MTDICLEREEHRIEPVVIEHDQAPIMENSQTGKDVDIYQIPVMRHHYMDGGPYIVMSTITKERQFRHLQLLVPPHGGQVAPEHGAVRLAAPPVEDLQGLRGQQHGVPRGHRAGASPGLPHGRVLQRRVRGERVRHHRRLHAGAPPAHAVRHLGRQLPHPGGRRGGHRRTAPAQQAGGGRALRRGPGLSRAAALHHLRGVQGHGHELAQGGHVPVHHHAGRRQAVDGPAAGRRLSPALPRGGARRDRGVQDGPPCPLQRLHRHEEALGRRPGPGGGRGPDLRPHQETSSSSTTT